MASWYLVIGTVVALGAGQSNLKQSPSLARLIPPRVKEFLPIYQAYVNSFHAPNASGVRQLATQDFKLGYKRDFTRGDKAIGELYSYASAVAAGDLDVKVVRLDIRGNRAVAWTTLTCHFPDSPKRTGWTSMTASWDWKHTWRHTSSGWQLAVVERFDGKMPASPFSFTLRSPAPAKSPTPSASPQPSPAHASYIPPRRPGGR